jgi:Domain of unknown function (DUF4190)
MADQADAWYLRARGRILGPFTWVQLESLRDRGKLMAYHEVSQDRRAWTAAASLSGLFAQSAQRMAASGEINPSAHVPYKQVWTEGTSVWVLDQQVPEPECGAVTADSFPDLVGQSLSSTPVHAPTRTNRLAIASLVMGIIWLFGLGSLLAIILGTIALTQISRFPGRLEGKGLAIAGMVLGVLGLWLFAILILTGVHSAILR